LWQTGQCFASKLSMVTSNMLLQPMQTRWILGLGFSPGLVSAGAWELCGSLINAFYHDAGIADGTRVSSLGAMQLLEITGILCDSGGILLTGGTTDDFAALRRQGQCALLQFDDIAKSTLA
jgi:hypothetical protein